MSYVQYIEHTQDQNNVIELRYEISELDREERTTEVSPVVFEEFLGKNGYLDEDRKEFGYDAFYAFMRDFENQSPAFYERVFKEYVTWFLGDQIATEIDTIIHHYQLIKNSFRA